VISLPLELYERERPPRRNHFEMVLPRSVRQDMLRKEWNVTQAQIAAAIRANVRAKSQRRATISNFGKAERLEEMMESASRKVMRSLFLRKSTSKQVKELDSKFEAAERARVSKEMHTQYDDEYKLDVFLGHDESNRNENGYSGSYDEKERDAVESAEDDMVMHLNSGSADNDTLIVTETIRDQDDSKHNLHSPIAQDEINLLERDEYRELYGNAKIDNNERVVETDGPKSPSNNDENQK
jgi:hypothetical protein